VKYPMHRMQGLLRSPTSGTYPPWLTWGTSCPVCSLQSQEWLMGSIPPSTIGTTERWYVNAFTQGNDLPWNAQTVLACQCAMDACPGTCILRPYGFHENSSSIPSCNTSVKRVYCFHEQTNNSAVHSARQTTHRTYQGEVRMPIGHRGNSACFADGRTRRGAPALSARNKDSLLSPWLEGQGSYARYDNSTC